MKYKFLSLLSVLAVTNINAQVNNPIMDFNSVPSLRSANEFGNTLKVNYNIGNKKSKLLCYGLEFLISIQYFTSIHELGHANIGKYYNCSIEFGDKQNWWNTIYNHPITPITWAFGNVNEIEFAINGFNATTNFAEQNPNSNFVLDFLCRVSSIVYIRKDSASDFVELEDLGYKTRKPEFLTAQICTYLVSKIGNRQFYAYLNVDGMSIRTIGKYKDFSYSVESLISRENYNCEFGISKIYNYKGFRVKPEIVTSLRGIGYNISATRGNFTIGYRNPNVNTLSGTRELNREFYAQFRL
jgi:hypothetical protein